MLLHQYTIWFFCRAKPDKSGNKTANLVSPSGNQDFIEKKKIYHFSAFAATDIKWSFCLVLQIELDCF